jgi:hypothetical protein
MNVTLLVERCYLRKSHDKSNEADCICFFLVALFDVHSFDRRLSEPSSESAGDRCAKPDQSRLRLCLPEDQILLLHD